MFSDDFYNNGYLISKKILNENDIHFIRKELDEEFDGIEKNAKALHHFKKETLVRKILSLYKHKILQEIKEELKKVSKTNLCVLPNFAVQKNYHVDLKQFHGWHRDCSGELKYDYCNKILAQKNYIFSKIGFYLQENTDYGGSIDIIKNSHRNFSKFKVIIRKIKNIPFRIITFIHTYFRNFYNLIPESFFMFFLNAKKLHPEIGSAVIFSSKIIHRGSPISKKINDVKFKEGSYQAFTPKNFTKYSIYCHFGTMDGVDSYFYDRLKRKDIYSINELKIWTEQIKFISKYDLELANEMSELFNPIREKYSII